MGANGPLTLSVPVFEGPGAKALMKDQKLSWDHSWQQIHWRSIVSSYKNSPFFDYYADDLAPFYHQRKWKYLIEYNSEIQDILMKTINYKPNIQYTSSYVRQGETPDGTDDFRYSIHPKPHRQETDNEFNPVPYHQVFSDRFGFMPNLTILDLLFNEGPGTLDALKACSENNK